MHFSARVVLKLLWNKFIDLKLFLVDTIMITFLEFHKILDNIDDKNVLFVGSLVLTINSNFPNSNLSQPKIIKYF
jgi:hypothetical protein